MYLTIRVQGLKPAKGMAGKDSRGEGGITLNIEHRTSNVELENHSTFDLPEADKCLLAYGELNFRRWKLICRKTTGSNLHI